MAALILLIVGIIVVIYGVVSAINGALLFGAVVAGIGLIVVAFSRGEVGSRW